MKKNTAAIDNALKLRIKKNPKIALRLMIIIGICGMAAGVVLLVFIAATSINLQPGDDTQRPVIIAMMVIFMTGAIFFAFGLGFFKSLPKYASRYSANHLRKKNKIYMTYPLRKITDFEAELEQTRSAFAADNDPQKNMITYREVKKLGILAYYMSAHNIALHYASDIAGLYDYNTIDCGKIYYGCLVQANMFLFREKKKLGHSSLNEYPACILYSQDPFFEKDPLKLIPIARQLFADKENNELKNEQVYKYHQELPAEQTAGKKIFMTTIMIDRTLLPMNVLLSGIFPIIAAPHKSKSVFIVDDKYWTKNLVANFIYDSFEGRDGSELIFGEFKSSGNDVK